MYGHHQRTAVEQQQMTYLKNQTRTQTFNQPKTQSSSDPVRRQNHTSERGPYTVLYNGPLPYPDHSGVHQNPPDVETLSPRDAVSEMKRQLYFLDSHLNKIQNSLGELKLVPGTTTKSTGQKLVVKQRNLWPSGMQGKSITTPLDLSMHPTDPFNNANETRLQRLNSVLTPSNLQSLKIRVSRLPDTENEESQNCNKAITLYNQMYADALLSRQLQDEESNSLELKSCVAIC